MAEPTPPQERPRTSTRDRAELRDRLRAWLAGRLPAGAAPEISDLEAPEATGMSSETLMFEARWTEAGQARAERCVARLRPDQSALPVFPEYDLDRQYRVMRLVGERTSVPVPATLWFEGDEGPLGSPFFVMRRVDGLVPPDIMPYTLGSWLSEAPPADRARLQSATVGVLAGIHGLDATPAELAFLELDRPGDSALRRHLADQRAYYEWVAADSGRVPVLERTLAWLEDRFPEGEGDAVVSWGDSRIGNVMYRDFEPVAVLDWEMAALAPREVDIGWLLFMHVFFQDIAERAGLEGIPGFLCRDDVASAYESMTGHTPRHLEFYEAYAALRHGIVMTRVTRRSVHFGEAEMPTDPDDLVLHRGVLERMLDGSYWRTRP